MLCTSLDLPVPHAHHTWRLCCVGPSRAASGVAHAAPPHLRLPLLCPNYDAVWPAARNVLHLPSPPPRMLCTLRRSQSLFCPAIGHPAPPPFSPSQAEVKKEDAKPKLPKPHGHIRPLCFRTDDPAIAAPSLSSETRLGRLTFEPQPPSPDTDTSCIGPVGLPPKVPPAARLCCEGILLGRPGARA